MLVFGATLCCVFTLLTESSFEDAKHGAPPWLSHGEQSLQCLLYFVHDLRQAGQEVTEGNGENPVSSSK